MCDVLHVVDQLSKNCFAMHKEIKLEKENLSELKEKLKQEYLAIKEEKISLDEDFDLIKIDDIILKERKSVKYKWTDDFYEEIINRGIAHLVLKPGNNMNKRFDLSPYELPKNPENRILGFRPPTLSPKEKEEFEKKLTEKRALWEPLNLEESARFYVRMKKILDLKTGQYEAEKKKLLNVMKEENIEKTMEGYYLRDEPTRYDFKKLYFAELEETVLLATNGSKCVDLMDDNLEVKELPEDLYNVEKIKKRFGEKKLNQLKQLLGENFYFIKGYRREKNILKRFPVSASDVELAVENGLLPLDILNSGRIVQKEEDLKLVFEIVTEDSAARRYSAYNGKKMKIGLKASGYYQ